MKVIERLAIYRPKLMRGLLIPQRHWADLSVNIEMGRRQMGYLGMKSINLLKPTGHVMHQQFNIQQLYALPTLY